MNSALGMLEHFLYARQTEIRPQQKGGRGSKHGVMSIRQGAKPTGVISLDGAVMLWLLLLALHLNLSVVNVSS